MYIVHLYVIYIYIPFNLPFLYFFLPAALGDKALSVGSRLRLGLLPGLLCFTQRLSSCICLRILVAHTGTHR